MLPAHSTPRIVSKEREKIDNYCDLKYLELSFTTSHPNSNWCTGNSFERIWRVAETVGNATLHGTFIAKTLLVCWIVNHIKDRTDGTEYPRSQAVT